MIRQETPPETLQEEPFRGETKQPTAPRFTAADLSEFRQNLLRLTFVVVLSLVILAVFVPLNPSMPGPTLDAPWMMAMNEAVAQHLVFGKDIIFSFGPYASIYTELYHPATDHLMIGGSLFLGLATTAVVLLLGTNQKSYLALLFGFLLAVLANSRDALLYSYPFMTALVVHRMTLRDSDALKLRIRRSVESGVAILFAPLGLLPLVKVSLVPLCVFIAVLCVAMFWRSGRRSFAYAVVIIPVVSCAFFWEAAHQPLLGLPGYFLGAQQIIAGYTEAMAFPGDSWECFLYLFASAILLLIVMRTLQGSRISRVFLGASYGFFLFLAFKGGFVRHDPWHNITAGSAILIAACLLVFVLGEKSALLPIASAALVWAYMGQASIHNVAYEASANPQATFAKAIRGLSKRWQAGELRKEYDQSIAAIHDQFPIGRFDGTTDIYSVHQSWLLASENTWAPRPIVQSYSAYTPTLAERNLLNLTGDRAPDNIIFRVEPIDGRLPSLEDGLSWPALVNRYTLTKLDERAAYFRKRNIEPALDPLVDPELYSGQHQFGEEVFLPDLNAPLFARIQVRPSLVGRILGVLYKLPQLQMSMRLRDGRVIRYRVISEMMKADFLITPLVKSTEEFALFAAGGTSYLTSNEVKSVTLSSEDSRNLFWKSNYSVSLRKFELTRGAEAENLRLFDTMTDRAPRSLLPPSTLKCEGSIESLNGSLPLRGSASVSGALYLSGWMGVSAKDGIVPDSVFVSLTSQSGKAYYVQAHGTRRDDVKLHFNRPEMPNPGYAAMIDVSGLKGAYTLGLARTFKGNLGICQQFKLPLFVNR